MLSKIVQGYASETKLLDTAILPFLFLGVNFGTPESRKPENPLPKAKSVDAYIFRHAYLFIYLCLEYF